MRKLLEYIDYVSGRGIANTTGANAGGAVTLYSLDWKRLKVVKTQSCLVGFSGSALH
jgi:hypothetical protein